MLLPFFEWCEASFIGQAIRNSLWLFPVIEAVHLLGLAVIGGAVLIVDLRMLGIGLRQPIAEIARDARPFLIASIVVAGRMIAYNWFDCDIQPQPDFINWAAGCNVPPQ